MNLYDVMTRRQAIKKVAQVSGSLAFTGLFARTPQRARATSEPERFVVEGVGREEGFSVRALIEKTFDAAGGIGRFVSRGDVVVIKPNISWARPPQLAASTNPDVLQAVIELCQAAGAKEVRIADNTIHDARRCFAITGVGEVAKKTGAELIFPRSSLMREMKLRGKRLDVWPVFVPVVEGDKLINLPVAKHHALSTLTLGMKNWIGAVGGRRSALHQDVHQTIVDLSRFFKPTVTLIDATRIMIRNGPSGGSAADVATRNTVILSDDQVAADAKGAGLFGRRPEEIGFLRLAQQEGLGSCDLSAVAQKRVVL